MRQFMLITVMQITNTLNSLQNVRPNTKKKLNEAQLLKVKDLLIEQEQKLYSFEFNH